MLKWHVVFFHKGHRCNALLWKIVKACSLWSKINPVVGLAFFNHYIQTSGLKDPSVVRKDELLSLLADCVGERRLNTGEGMKNGMVARDFCFFLLSSCQVIHQHSQTSSVCSELQQSIPHEICRAVLARSVFLKATITCSHAMAMCVSHE